MHKDLISTFNKSIEILKRDERCKGAWHFGSVGRGMQDIYSDYDIVLLISDEYFEEFSADIPKLMSEISDELLVCWAEDFNNDCIKNFCGILRIGDDIHQLDLFIINQIKKDDWLVRFHCEGKIIFDKANEVSAFLEQNKPYENHAPDTIRVIETYWFHVAVLVKYFKRADIFKIIKNVDILFRAHVNLLLSFYDTINWGGWESKVKHCVPANKQENVKAYFTAADIDAYKTVIKKCILLFESDAEQICISKNITYSHKIPQKIIAYFNKEVI